MSENRCIKIMGLALGLLASTLANAGYGVGTVGQLLVGRLGDQVYVELLSASIASWPCSATHPNGFRYAFLLSQAGGRDMLATVLAAKAAGQLVQIVGSGACTIDATLENALYVVAQ